VWTEEKLNSILTTPSKQLVEDIKKIDGDIMVLGAGGKMGPTLCVLAKRAAEEAGISKRIIAVSRFSDAKAKKELEDKGVETLSCDLIDREALDKLPDVENIIFMAGKKFGTDGQEASTWAMNTIVPAYVTDRFKTAKFVVFSSGNVYPIVPLSSGGCSEKDMAGPIGDYTMSVLGRERIFEYAAQNNGAKVFIYRLNFAVDLRYGVLLDVAKKVLNGEPISLKTPCFNFIWQGSANEIAIRALLKADSPAVKMNVTGPETVSIKYVAERFGEIFGKTPVYSCESGDTAYLSNSMACMDAFGYPDVSAEKLIKWQAEYLLDGGIVIDKPTHFEEREGVY